MKRLIIAVAYMLARFTQTAVAENRPAGNLDKY